MPIRSVSVFGALLLGSLQAENVQIKAEKCRAGQGRAETIMARGLKMSQHTLELHLMADGRIKALAWRNWYSERYAENAYQHHRFQFRNGLVHVLCMNCEVARDVAELFVAKWFDGDFATYVFTNRATGR